MHFWSIFLTAAATVSSCGAAAVSLDQAPLLVHASTGRNVSLELFAELEELARLVDISYCVGALGLGVSKPFSCVSRCAEFPDYELVTTWNTGVLLSDSCGYIALDHTNHRIIAAFRGTYSIANTVVDLSTVPQEYVPYPGSEPDDDDTGKKVAALFTGEAYDDDTSTLPKVSKPQPKCNNCTVHMGFYRAWRNTREAILKDLTEQVASYPSYRVTLVGHSLGGAVAALAGLDLMARGWNPQVTTFGEPRVGNAGFVRYLDERFGLESDTKMAVEEFSSLDKLQYRRVTHVDDPVPLLPLTEWGYVMHAGEIHISKPSLSPDVQNLQHCIGDNDQDCIAGQDSTVAAHTLTDATTDIFENGAATSRKRDLLTSVHQEIEDVVVEPWGIPSRYKLWQLFFAHRDYFWRLGLCVPGGDPLGGGSKYEHIAPPVGK